MLSGAAMVYEGSVSGHDRGPGLAWAPEHRPSHPNFEGMLRDALRCPHAAQSLAEAFTKVGPAERRRLLASVRHDALERDLPVARLLALLASLEDRSGAHPAMQWEAWQEPDRVVIRPRRGSALSVERGEVRILARATTRRGHRMALDEAVDELVRVLWAAREAGRPWPRGMSAFVDLFDA